MRQLIYEIAVKCRDLDEITRGEEGRMQGIGTAISNSWRGKNYLFYLFGQASTIDMIFTSGMVKNATSQGSARKTLNACCGKVQAWIIRVTPEESKSSPLSKKNPGLNRVGRNSEHLKTAIKARPERFIFTFNTCLEWQTTRWTTVVSSYLFTEQYGKAVGGQ